MVLVQWPLSGAFTLHPGSLPDIWKGLTAGEMNTCIPPRTMGQDYLEQDMMVWS